MLAYSFGAMGGGKSAYSVMTAQQRHRPRAHGHPQTAGRAGHHLGPGRTGRHLTHRVVGPRAAPDAGHVRPEVFGDAQTIVVDEAQFLAVAHVEALVALSNSGREVICFGLRTDFRGQLFPGAAQRLFERADVIGQVGLEPRCATCDRTAVINARFVHGRLMRTGPVIVLGDSAGLQHSEATRYEPLCVRC